VGTGVLLRVCDVDILPQIVDNGVMKPPRKAPARTRVPGAGPTLPAKLAERLLQEIIGGKLAPGTRLTETGLSERHAVSRATVRAALAQVARHGMVQVQPRLGARVVEMSNEEVLELFQIRGVLLGLAARRAATEARESELAAFDRSVAALEALARREGTTATAYSNETLGTQQLLLAMSHSRWIGELYEQISNLTLWRTFVRKKAIAFVTAERRRGSAAGWRRLADALRKRDPQASESTAGAILEASGNFAYRALNARP
jgi:DNA-binding GntR family transcriptional regulator